MRVAVASLGVWLCACASATPNSGADAGPRDGGAAAAAADGGSYEIYDAERCPSVLAPQGLAVRATRVCAGPTGACVEERGCRRSADCTQRAGGRCRGYVRNGYIEYTQCSYGVCDGDADCSADRVCACTAARVASCIEASCRSDADCASGHRCVRADDCALGPYGEFLCTSDQDECLDNGDCQAQGAGNSCTVIAGHLACQSIICDPG
jgi:hypothetical protein